MVYSNLVGRALNEGIAQFVKDEFDLGKVTALLRERIESLPCVNQREIINAATDIKYVRLWHCLDEILNTSEVGRLIGPRIEVLKTCNDVDAKALGLWSFVSIKPQSVLDKWRMEVLDYLSVLVEQSIDSKLKKAVFYLCKAWVSALDKQPREKVAKIETLLFAQLDAELASDLNLYLIRNEAVTSEELCQYLSFFEDLDADQLDICVRIDGSLAKYLLEFPRVVLHFVEEFCFRFQYAEMGLYRLPCFLNEIIKNHDNILGRSLSRWLSSKDIRHVSMAMAFESARMCQFTYGKDPYKDIFADLIYLDSQDDIKGSLVRIIFRAMGTYNLQPKLAARLCFSCIAKLDLATVSRMEDNLFEGLILNHYAECKDEMVALQSNCQVLDYIISLMDRAMRLFKEIDEHKPCKELAVGSREQAVAFRRNLQLYRQSLKAAMKESLTTKLFGEPKRMIRGKGVIQLIVAADGKMNETEFDMQKSDIAVQYPKLMVTHGLRMARNGTFWRVSKEFGL